MSGSEAVHNDGLIGCFRGLVMNNEVVNLYAYMNARFPDMIRKHCRPSCDPNPCLNGAVCVEYWGSYKCLCSNPLANFGHNCETGYYYYLLLDSIQSSKIIKNHQKSSLKSSKFVFKLSILTYRSNKFNNFILNWNQDCTNSLKSSKIIKNPLQNHQNSCFNCQY